jgi:hypothetical protein
LQVAAANDACQKDWDATPESVPFKAAAATRAYYQKLVTNALKGCAQDKLAGLNSPAAQVRPLATAPVMHAERPRVDWPLQLVCESVKVMLQPDNPSATECDILDKCKVYVHASE